MISFNDLLWFMFLVLILSTMRKDQNTKIYPTLCITNSKELEDITYRDNFTKNGMHEDALCTTRIASWGALRCYKDS